MKFLKFLPFLLFLLILEVSGAESKIAVIDNSKIAEKSTAYADASKVLSDKMKSFEESAIQAGKSFSKKAEDLESKKNVMSSKEYNRKRDELTKEEEALQKKFYNQRVTLDKQFNNFNQVFEDNFKKIINKLAKEKGITIIFNKALTLYSNDSIDITDDVIDILNKELKSIDIASK